ncbi:hypothetical protein RHSIM_Rhsim01G0252000 [Rhododendron simsii]|uniref:Uncharacterized protein n=1 Tax=Rhododendron simsii TaxID=118357 RepID=A0A834HJS7_RHOSS|nr:hypothetical protein RHSIM_Rhsim01G0252000 [Rhododendron simsii]
MAVKLRQHQISGGGGSSPAAAAAKSSLLQLQLLFQPRGVAGGFPRTNLSLQTHLLHKKLVFKGVAPDLEKDMYQAVKDALEFMEANATRDSGISAVTSSGPHVAPNGNCYLMGRVCRWLLGRMVEIWQVQFVADGVFFAELNDMLTREVAEGRVTPMQIKITIRATRYQNILGDYSAIDRI